MEKLKNRLGRKFKNDEARTESPLMEALGFTADDLAANQEGVLSENQHQMLQGARRRILREAVAIILIAVCFGSIMLLFAVGSGNSDAGTLFMGSVVFALAAVLWGSRERYKLNHDLRENSVQDWQGSIKLKLGSSKEFFVQVGKVHLRVTEKAFLALRNGDPYVIYYAPNSKTILSAEWLGEGES